MRFAALATGVCLALSIVPVVSAWSGSILDDTARFQRVLSDVQREEQRQVQEDAEQESEEFFPVSGSGAQGDANTFSAFVTIQWRNEPIELKDVPRQAWFAPYVRDMANRGVVTGYRDAAGKPLGTFGPERPVSIEEMAKTVLAVAGIDPASCSVPPQNVSARGRWSQQYIRCAEERMLTAFRDPTLDVTRQALRGEVVLTLLEAFGVVETAPVQSGSLVVSGSRHPGTATGETVIVLAGSGSYFTDVSPESVAGPAILRAAADGIVSGFRDAKGNPAGLFGPDKPVARAEIAKILSLGLQVYGKKSEKK